MNVFVEKFGEVLLPDFFIVGAAKGGTTSLHYYLKEHPAIYMPMKKESWFFSFADNPPEYVSPSSLPGVIYKIEDYSKLFDHSSEHQQLGDASPSYLYTYNTAIRNIKTIYDNEFNHNHLKFLVTLRNPVERAWSQYWTFKRAFKEPLDFKDAINEGTINSRLTNNWNIFYDYIGFGMYYYQVKAFIDEFGSENVKILLFEDLQRNARDVCKRIFQFLNVDTSFSPNTDVIYNISGKPKSKALHKLSLQPNVFKTILKKFIPYETKMKIKHFLLGKTLTRVEMPNKIKRELTDLYRPEIEKVEELIRRDLTAWIS